MAVGLENLPEDALEALATPRVSLPAMGHVIDQKTGKTLRFDPHAITHKLQETILSYVSDTPRTEIGQTHWLALLGYRQGGKSLTAELGGYPHAAYRPGWDHVCLDPETEVIRPDGSLTPIGELCVGDEVVTHTGAVAPVAQVMWSRKPTVRIRTWGYSEDIVSSPEHEHFTLRGKVPAGEIRAGDWLGSPVHKITGERTTLHKFGKNRRGVQRCLPPVVPANYAWGRVFGLYLAEGHIPWSRRDGMTRPYVVWTVHEDEVPRTLEWLEAAGVPRARISVTPRNGKGVDVIANSRQVSDLMLALGGRVSQKHWPDRWWELPYEFLRGALEGLFAGDGHLRESDGTTRATLVGKYRGLIVTARDVAASLYGVWGSLALRGKNRDTFFLDWSGSSARILGRAWGHDCPEPDNPSWRRAPGVCDGYAWVMVRAVEPGPVQDLVDIEVDHEDHTFRLIPFATSNCIADRKDRAEYLHQRLHVCHKNWPAEFRSPTRASNEVRQLTFENGSRMRVLSGESGAVGIGQSPDFFHGSELPYWTDAGGQMSLIIPSMINRDHGLMVLESTPAPMDEPSAEWWRDHYFEAKKGMGRWLSAFFPFWDGKLNRRPWPKGSQPDLEELRLLERYGPSGLGYEHLAFRRELMQSDRQIRRNPDLFGVYYPFDDSSCWLASSSGVIHRSILERHRKRTLTPWEGRTDTFHYVEYEPPHAGAVYLVCVDPVGWGARDHGSFHVLKCYVGEWTQVAVGSGTTDPVDLADAVEKAHLRYGEARIAVERNGPGEGFLGMLIQKGIRNIHYDDKAKPGVWKHSDSEMLAQLIDALRVELVLNDQDTLDQLLSYRNDKVVEKSVKAEIMASQRRDRRRGRHHWDKVSALAVGVVAARGMPRRYKPETNPEPQNVVLFKDMTWNQVEKYRQQVSRDQSKRGRKRSGRARYTRKRRK